MLTTIERDQKQAGLGEIVLTYTAVSQSTPATTYAEQSSQIEEDIRTHPHFADWADDWDEEKGEFKPSSDKYGIKSYIKGTTTVTKTEYFTSKPSSARDTIGKLESPGLDYGDSAKWLLVGANRSKQGSYWVMQRTYLYSAVDYSTDIYGS